ncbi:diguanylate cyclase (GGDEF) domain-containing protein [Sulfurivirga caldicuralii]|uniref:diguanylate cyclase n=1 Tax=Sulfurivirga caldicuralii TaxID=364032 RepID=A0A1N6DQ00_9GAMM|nr:sensor domain-containing diguanylate cyclase [Sulfurivirga caldicuralii]SIN72872.1 diguanylate cyclase (GGDEF) domain-containing protein [Sulfurivirga caldicuralii]
MFDILHIKHALGFGEREAELLRAVYPQWRAAWTEQRAAIIAWAREEAIDGRVLSLLDDSLFPYLIASGAEIAFAEIYQRIVELERRGVPEYQDHLLLSRVREAFIDFAEAQDNRRLAQILCHLVDLVQSILAITYQLEALVARFQERAEYEVARIRRLYALIDRPAPEVLLNAFTDHQAWKIRAFRYALGEKETGQSELDPAKCRLGRWLQQGGWSFIPESEREAFDAAHRQVHDIAAQIVEYARTGDVEGLLTHLWAMEAASEAIGQELLKVIDSHFVTAATLDPLTDLPNRRSFELDAVKLLRLGKRHNLYVAVHLLDIDLFKRVNDTLGHAVGDQVLKGLVEMLQPLLRKEDRLYRWGGEEFVLLTLHEDARGAEAFAQRLLSRYDPSELQKRLALPWPITFSLGSLLIPPDFAELPPEGRLFDAVDQLLYRAKENGRNQAWFGIVNEKGYLREDTVHRV